MIKHYVVYLLCTPKLTNRFDSNKFYYLFFFTVLFGVIFYSGLLVFRLDKFKQFWNIRYCIVSFQSEATGKRSSSLQLKLYCQSWISSSWRKWQQRASFPTCGPCAWNFSQKECIHGFCFMIMHLLTLCHYSETLAIPQKTQRK